MEKSKGKKTDKVSNSIAKSKDKNKDKGNDKAKHNISLTSSSTSTSKKPGKPKRSLRSSKSNKNMNVYSSLVYKSRVKSDEKARKRAEDLASLPKNPVKRFFAHLHPKRVFKYWFSWRGVKTILKTFAALALLIIIAIGGLFLYFKKDLEAIKLDEIKVSETVNTYYDRNGELLWEDKGDGDYRLVVDGDQIATYMRQATVAIEDKNFYNHPGVDWTALIRASFATLSGQGVQGGSTLTQQLIKQVYFSDEANDRGLSGIPRKIKEAILALEIEKMYDKEQIITMYLNESPYGGRRNGVESAAQTYFGKSAKDLNLAESAFLAAIPNNPAILNPYNEAGNEALISRQHKTLDVMVELGYITEQQAEEAKQIPIMDQVLPETDQYKDIKAPHFVLEVKKQLEEKYGVKTMRAGGFTIKTTLNYGAQQMAEAAVATGANMMYANGSDNIALSSIDVETGQVIAMVGSSSWDAPVYGQVNAATSLLEPGSSIKPILDYTPLFVQREGQNYAPGVVLKDENIDSIYCGGYSGSCQLRNYTGKFYGNVTIRQSLANSLNIAAVKALYLNGIDNSLKVAHGLGDLSYCAEDGSASGLAIAIGSGCNVRQVEHANAYASLARGGVYKPLSYILEVKNSSGDVIESWEDTAGERVVDEQVAYMTTNILEDASARSLVFGSQAYSYGFNIANVTTATKTGTTTTAVSVVAKDSWIASYSPVVSTVIWNGNHDGRGLSSSDNSLVRRVVNDYMYDVHMNIYQNDGRWTIKQGFNRPAGIQNLTINGKSDIWPSWYNAKYSGTTKVTMEFNKFTKKLASECTPSEYRISIEGSKTTDPITKKDFYEFPDGYDHGTNDDCSYSPPSVDIYTSGRTINATVLKGSGNLATYELAVNGVVVETGSIDSTILTFNYKLADTDTSIRVTVSDDAGATASDEAQVSVSNKSSSSNNNESS